MVTYTYITSMRICVWNIHGNIHYTCFCLKTKRKIISVWDFPPGSLLIFGKGNIVSQSLRLLYCCSKTSYDCVWFSSCDSCWWPLFQFESLIPLLTDRAYKFMSETAFNWTVWPLCHSNCKIKMSFTKYTNYYTFHRGNDLSI